mgnify:CR=1 FL=1
MFAKRTLFHMKQTSNLATAQRSMMFQNQLRYFAVVRKYTKSHEWIELDTDTGIATIGITDHAQHELGDIVHVDLPSIGLEFSKQEAISCIESVKTAADIYQMCDGEVVEVNEDLNDDASLVNQDAEGKGWIMKVKMA